MSYPGQAEASNAATPIPESADGVLKRPRAGAATRPPASRIEFADALRGLAALTVIIAHLGGVYWLGGPMVAFLTGVPYVAAPTQSMLALAPIGWFGPFGVALFFVISGFVIPFSLLQYDVKGFAIGRLFRIWPTCWAGLSVTVLSVVLGVHFMGGEVPFTFRDAATHFFPPFASIADSRQIDSVMWTLEIEMFFYVICALAVNHLRDGRWTVWLFPIALFLFWLCVDQATARLHDTHPAIVRRLLSFETDPVYIVFMFCGVALNMLQRGKLGLIGAAAAVALCAGMFWAAQVIGHMPFTADIVVYLGGFALFAVSMLFQRFFVRTRLTRFFSDISYPLYVVHGVAGYVVLQAMMRAGWNADVATFATMGLAIAVAYAIHALVEKPSHRIGQKLARRISGRAA